MAAHPQFRRFQPVLPRDSLDQGPERLLVPPLQYPRQLLRDGWEASVMVIALVDAAGRVQHVDVCGITVTQQLRTAAVSPRTHVQRRAGERIEPEVLGVSRLEPEREFERSVREFMRRLTFTPARKDGLPMASVIMMPINFRIRGP